MILIYRIFTNLIYPFLFLFVYYRKIIGKEDPLRFKEKILVSCFRIKKKENSKLFWFHAASIGEFKSIIPIINKLNEDNKNLKFLITTTTLSSGNLAKVELNKFTNTEHRYFPFDINFIIKKFLRSWKPDKIFLVDSEIWPNLILAANEYKIPIALLNGRLTSKSSKRWMVFPNTARFIFRKLNLCLCSNLETKNFLERLNVRQVYYKGNIKLIDEINQKEISNVNMSYLSNKRFWFAASTHKEEEKFCLSVHIELKKKFNDIITIIAPRHVERAKSIQALFKKSNFNAQILNHNEDIQEKKEIVIVNYFGAFNSYFKCAKSVFIGKSIIKSLKNDSGQNPIEAAKLDCKIYHGPYVYNFEDIYKLLENNNISKKIKNHKELSEYLSEDLKNPHKLKNKNTNPINNIGEKTLADTMLIINNFLNDKII